MNHLRPVVPYANMNKQIVRNAPSSEMKTKVFPISLALKQNGKVCGIKEVLGGMNVMLSGGSGVGSLDGWGLR